MKKFYLIAIVGLFLVSCENNIESPKQVNNDYSSEISKMRVSLAQKIVQSISENSQVDALIIDECKKRFDGDANVLCKDLFEKSVAINQNLKLNLGNILRSEKSKNESSKSDSITMLLVKDSLVQIYYYTSNENNDFVGIVVIPENIKENDGKNLLVIKKDGQITYISSDIAPIENYLVISRNERSDWTNSALINSPSKVQMRESSTGKYLKITKAKFTSIGAKRTVESWWAGEPEVRLNVIYPYINNVNQGLKYQIDERSGDSSEDMHKQTLC